MNTYDGDTCNYNGHSRKKECMQTGQGSYFRIQLVNKYIHFVPSFNETHTIVAFRYHLESTKPHDTDFLLTFVHRRPKKGECEKAVFYAWSISSNNLVRTFFKILLPFFLGSLLLFLFSLYALTRHQHTHTHTIQCGEKGDLF